MPEQDSSSSPGDVGELMRAIYATHPKVYVDASLSPWDGKCQASVTVLGLPEHFATLESAGIGWSLWCSEEPTKYGIHLRLNRHVDDDIAAALTTALAFITEHSSAVAS